jgi:hypothetical protein
MSHQPYSTSTLTKWRDPVAAVAMALAVRAPQLCKSSPAPASNDGDLYRVRLKLDFLHCASVHAFFFVWGAEVCAEVTAREFGDVSSVHMIGFNAGYSRMFPSSSQL